MDLDINEPMFVIRGSDPLAAAAIHAYATLALAEGENDKAKAAFAAETEIEAWRLAAVSERAATE